MNNRKLFIVPVAVLGGILGVLAIGAGALWLSFTIIVNQDNPIMHEHVQFELQEDRNGKLPPVNPYLAESSYPIAHGNSAQQDSVPQAGPLKAVESSSASESELEVIEGSIEELTVFTESGPFQFGQFTSSPYSDGSRVLWGSGPDRIVKLDYKTGKVIDTLILEEGFFYPPEKEDEIIAELESRGLLSQYSYILLELAPMLMELSGVYTLLDNNNEFYVGGFVDDEGTRGVTVYGDADPQDRNSPIVKKRSFALPEGIDSPMIGMNMTFDGTLILATEMGDLIGVSRDFSEYALIKLDFSEEAATGAPNGYGWVRNTFALDQDGGIYLTSQNHMHKIIWNGESFSKKIEDGAWTEQYNNSRGNGSGSTPSLMGFGDEDEFVVITDGDKVMNLVLYWRNEIPEDWIQLPGTSSRRVAGILPVDMGGRVGEVQSEQSVLVMGHGAVVVNNEPQNVPKFLRAIDPRISALIAGFIGNQPEIQPYGMQKFHWNTETQSLKSSWINTEVSSLNAMPIASYGSNSIYTLGAKDGIYTLEAIDWTTGSSIFSQTLGGHRYNTLFSGILINEEGQIHYTSLWGKIHLNL